MSSADDWLVSSPTSGSLVSLRKKWWVGPLKMCRAKQTNRYNSVMCRLIVLKFGRKDPPYGSAEPAKADITTCEKCGLKWQRIAVISCFTVYEHIRRTERVKRRRVTFELAIWLLLVGLRCYVCDSRSVIGYYDAEKDCNTDRSLQECPDVKVSITFMSAILGCVWVKSLEWLKHCTLRDVWWEYLSHFNAFSNLIYRMTIHMHLDTYICHNVV